MGKKEKKEIVIKQKNDERHLEKETLDDKDSIDGWQVKNKHCNDISTPIFHLSRHSADGKHPFVI